MTNAHSRPQPHERRTRRATARVLALVLAGILATCAHGGQWTPPPPGVAVLAETSDLSSLERGIMFFANAAMPQNQPGLSGMDFDQAFKLLQNSGQMPSIVDPMVQQFFGLPGFKFNRARGCAMALLIPGANDSASGELCFAAWLPATSYPELVKGVAVGWPEWGHITPHPDADNIYVVNFNNYGGSRMYLTGGTSGVILSSTLWGLARAGNLWRNGAPTLPSDSGFAARIRFDFAQPGVEKGLVALLESPGNAVINRLRQGGGPLLGDITLYGLLHAIRETTRLDLHLAIDSRGVVAVDADIAAKAGGELGGILADPTAGALTSRQLRAMPDDLAFALAVSPGEMMRRFITRLLQDALGSLPAQQERADSINRRAADIIRGVMVMLETASGDASAAVTREGNGLAVFAASSPEAAGKFAAGIPFAGDLLAARSSGRDIMLGIGHNAGKIADDMLARATVAGDAPLRPEINAFIDSLGGKGVFAAILYPADITRLLLIYKAKETYFSADGGNQNNPLDMFATAFLGQFVRSLDAVPPGKHVMTLSAASPEANRLRMRIDFSLLSLSEIMGVYQRAILSFVYAPDGHPASATGGENP